MASKIETEQPVFIGVFKVLALENVCWGAAKFHDTKLWDAELFLWLFPMVVVSEGSRMGCAASVAAGMKQLRTLMFVIGFKEGKLFQS